VFALTDSCLTTKVDKNFNTLRKKWFAQLRRDKEAFPVTDLGAGSRKIGSMRSAAKLLKTSSSKGIYGDVLYKLARYFQPSVILELGTSIGVGTVHLKKGCPAAHILTVEGCPNTLAKACAQFDQWGLSGVTTLNASFAEVLKHPPFQLYDMVYLDGHHDGKATLEYLQILDAQTHDETLFILDDIRWSNGMWEAWQQLVQNPHYHVTVDLGRMGLIWKRPQQTKEHFAIRPRILKTKLV